MNAQLRKVPSPLLQQLEPALQRGDFQAVLDLCQMWLSQPTAEAWFWAGVAADQLEQDTFSAQALFQAYREHESWAFDYVRLWQSNHLLVRYCQKACYNSGVFWQTQGKTEVALYFYQQALAFDPHFSEAWYNSGLIWQSQQDWPRALVAFEKSWHKNPAFEPGGLALGRLYLQQKESGRALAVFQLLQTQCPSIEAQLGLLQACIQHQCPEQAQQLVADLLTAYPQVAIVHNQVGLWWEAQNHWVRAKYHYEQALQLQPHLVEALNNLAHLVQQQGHWQVAEQSYHLVLQERSDYYPAHYNLGLLYAWMRQFDKSYEHLVAAQSLAPWESQISLHLAQLLFEQGQEEQAQALVQQSRNTIREQADGYYALAQMQFYRGYFAEARDRFQQVLQYRPDDPLYQLQAALIGISPPLSWAEEQVMQAKLDQVFQPFQPGAFDLAKVGNRLVQLQLSTLFEVVYFPLDVRGIRQAYARLFQPVHSHGLLGRIQPPFRLGFVVTAEHAAIFLGFMQGILQHLERQRFVIVIFCSPRERERLQQHNLGPAIEWHLLPADWQSACHCIWQAAIDLLYFWEVGTDPLNYWLGFVRLAPIQVTSWGSIATTGAPEIDYFLSQAYLDAPRGQQDYTEKLVLLSHLPMCFLEPPEHFLYPRSHWGLSESPRLYLCPQNFLKLSHRFGERLKAILVADPLGCIVLLGKTDGYAYQLLRSRWAELWDVFPERIHIVPPLPQPEYFSLLAQADVILDPIDYGGGKTAYDALALGCPVITWPGDTLRSRITAALYHEMGVLDLVAHSADEYTRLAVRVANDPGWRQGVVDKLVAARPMVVENLAGVRGFSDWCWETLSEASIRRLS